MYLNDMQNMNYDKWLHPQLSIKPYIHQKFDSIKITCNRNDEVITHILVQNYEYIQICQKSISNTFKKKIADNDKDIFLSTLQQQMAWHWTIYGAEADKKLLANCSLLSYTGTQALI